jgi:hypothetical protein
VVAITGILFIRTSGADGFSMQDRIDLWTTTQRTYRIMTQLDDLVSALQDISTDVDNEVSRLQQLQDQLTQLQNTTPPNVDLQPAIDLANSIRSRLESTSSIATNVAADTSSSDSSAADTGTSDAGVSGTSDAGVSGTQGTDPSVDPGASVTSGDSVGEAGPDTSVPPSE